MRTIFFDIIKKIIRENNKEERGRERDNEKKKRKNKMMLGEGHQGIFVLFLQLLYKIKIMAKIKIFYGKKFYDIGAEGSPIMYDLKAAWVVITAMCPLTFKLDQWKRQIGHSEPISNCKFNQGMLPIKADAPHVVSLLELPKNKAFGTWDSQS